MPSPPTNHKPDRLTDSSNMHWDTHCTGPARQAVQNLQQQLEDIVACWAQGDAACSFMGTDMPAIMVHVAGQNSHNSKSAYAGLNSKTTTIYLWLLIMVVLTNEGSRHVLPKQWIVLLLYLSQKTQNKSHFSKSASKNMTRIDIHFHQPSNWMGQPPVKWLECTGCCDSLLSGMKSSR